MKVSSSSNTTIFSYFQCCTSERATLIWVYYVVIYWTAIVLVPCIYYNDLSRYQYYFWIFGMIGVCSVYYAVKGKYPADSPGGKPIAAFTATIIATDSILNAYHILNASKVQDSDFVIMICHTIAILCATVFFYNRSARSKYFAWISLILEWFDLLFMVIAIGVLRNAMGECFSSALCIGYFVALTLNLALWFLPIMFGFNNSEYATHIHMIILNMTTDFPLILTILITKSYRINWFIFIDVAFKIILVIRCITYHGVINLVFRYHELKSAADRKEKNELQQPLYIEKSSQEDIALKIVQSQKQQVVSQPVENK